MATQKGGLSPNERHILQDDGESDDVLLSDVAFRVVKHRVKAKTQTVLNDAIILLKNSERLELRQHLIDEYGDDILRLLAECTSYVTDSRNALTNLKDDSTA